MNRVIRATVIRAKVKPARIAEVVAGATQMFNAASARGRRS
jgi:hypothetical protein